MPLPHDPLPGRLAGIDYGTVRIGVSLSDARQTIASPYENYTRRNPRDDAAWFRNLATREGIVRFVVGLPVHSNGLESAKSIESRAFGRWLETETNVPVDYYDERFSSYLADQYLGEASLTKKKRKQRRDMLAAQILLSAYLESHSRGADAPGALDG